MATDISVSQTSNLSLYHLLDPEVLANPYPLFKELRENDPVHWDPFLHAWVVTRYDDVVRVLTHFSANRTPTPGQLSSMGLSSLNPIAAVMVQQMLFMDPPAHTRLRSLSAVAFTPARVAVLREHIQEVCNRLVEAVLSSGRIEIMGQLAAPLPAIITAEMLGVPSADHEQLKDWSATFAEMLGNFQHNPEHTPLVLKALEGMMEYFRNAIRDQRRYPREGLIKALLEAEINGDRFSEEEVIANTIVTMVGGQETTTNLIGNGVLSLLRNPQEMERLRTDPSLIPSGIEELLRYESPSQHTARITPEDTTMGDKELRKRDAVVAVMAAANRDPERFPDPDRLDVARKDNRHVAFGWGPHFCFGAPLARIEGQVAIATILRKMKSIQFPPQHLNWRTNLGLRGLTELHVTFSPVA